MNRFLPTRRRARLATNTAVRYLRRLLLALSLLVLASLPVRAASGDRLVKLFPPDGVNGDRFGTAVDIDGSMAAVGADGQDDSGSSSGTVYLMDVVTGDFLQKIAPADGGTDDQFGFATSLYGDSVLVGAPFDDDNAVDAGSAYLFDTATGGQRVKLIAEDPEANGRFGWTVALNDNAAIVGAPYVAEQTGAVYFFDPQAGAPRFKLLATDTAVGDAFGSSIALHDTTAIIGAFGNDEAAPDAGAAYLFDVLTGTQRYKLTASDAQVADIFGFSVAISEEMAIVGAPFAANEDGVFAGAAYVFDIATGDQLWKLTADDGEVDDGFGLSVALEGNTAVVGAPYESELGDAAGAAYVFDLTTGSQVRKLTAPDGEYEDTTGWSVAIRGDRALVGAPFGVESDVISGVAHVFDVSSAPPALQAGDADQDLDFDQLDLVRVQIFAKYLTGQPATWGEGDWNGAPGGTPGDPPAGDGLFNQLDIVASQIAALYLTGPYAGLQPNDESNADGTSIGYDAATGEMWVEAPTRARLTSINVDSASGIFTADRAANLGGSFDNDADNNIFKATFGSSFGSLSFGHVAGPGLSEEFLRNDLSVIGSLEGGGDLGDVALVYIPIPEPSAVVLLGLGWITMIALRRRT